LNLASPPLTFFCQNIAMGTETLDKAGLKMFRNKFMKIAEGMQQESVKESALLMESMTESALAEDQKKKKGRSGLKLIFKKLDELVVKTKVAYIPLSKKIILLCSSFHIRTRAIEDLKSLFSSLHYVSGRSKSRPR